MSDPALALGVPVAARLAHLGDALTGAGSESVDEAQQHGRVAGVEVEQLLEARQVEHAGVDGRCGSTTRAGVGVRSACRS